MALSKQSRNIIIGGIAAVIIVAIAAYLLGRGCEQEETSTTRTTPTATTTTRTTPTAAATVTVEVTTPVPEPEPEPTPVPPAPEIISRSVTPEVVDPGDMLSFSAEVQGTATSVAMTVFHADSGTLALTLPLVQGATTGSVTTWSNTATAPAAKGIYRYFASATASDGSIVEMPGTSGWTFCVGDPAVDCT
jgi:hypothetical protein